MSKKPIKTCIIRLWITNYKIFLLRYLLSVTGKVRMLLHKAAQYWVLLGEKNCYPVATLYYTEKKIMVYESRLSLNAL